MPPRDRLSVGRMLEFALMALERVRGRDGERFLANGDMQLSLAILDALGGEPEDLS